MYRVLCPRVHLIRAARREKGKERKSVVIVATQQRSTPAQLLPKKVEALAGQRLVAVSAASLQSLALIADGAVWSWGFGAYGHLGHGDEQSQWQPKKIEALAGQRVVAASAGAVNSIAITADGTVFTWGQGGHGCLGHGEDLSNQLLPKRVEAWAPERLGV